MSVTHSKHPQSELYTDLIPAFKSRGLPGFAAQLTALESALKDGGDVDTAYATTISTIAANEPDVSLATRLTVLAQLTRTPANEFKLGVDDDGKVINAHEYQDAFGFVNAARAMLAEKSGTNVAEQASIAKVNEQLTIALNQFGELAAPISDGKASVIFGAAARIEIAALGLL